MGVSRRVGSAVAKDGVNEFNLVARQWRFAEDAANEPRIRGAEGSRRRGAAGRRDGDASAQRLVQDHDPGSGRG